MIAQATTISNALNAAQEYIDNLPTDDGLWLAEQRREAVSRLFDLGLPHTRQEAWRYTSVIGLLEQGFITADQPGEVPEAPVRQHMLQEPVAARLVFVDGLFQPALSDTLMAGVQISDLRGAMAKG